MISQGSIYLIVRDFDESVQFYKSLLERDVAAQNMNEEPNPPAMLGRME